MPRLILHLDLDAFFVSVELLDRPELRGKPVAVGGRAEARGVISSASYEARKFGVRSALPTKRALQLCPDLILLAGDHAKYAAHSRRIMAMLRTITPQVEPISIDEAFLDITGTELLHGPPEALAHKLHDQVRAEFGLPCSIGVATNKLVAKIATEQAKPDNVRIVPPGEEAVFLAPLPVRALWGVGPKTAAVLKAMRIEMIGQIVSAGSEALARQLGRRAADDLIRRAKGIDASPVVVEHEARQISQETTFARDVRDETQLRSTLLQLSEGVGRQLRGDDLGARTIAVKLRYGDFSTFTRQTTLPQAVDLDQAIFNAAWALFEANWDRRPIRLLGVAARQLGPMAQQLDLFAPHDERPDRLIQAVDEIRDRFGRGALKRASTLREED